jgi:O-antigen/teichoic acid export membrane protein
MGIYLGSAVGLKLITASLTLIAILAFSYLAGSSGQGILLLLIAALWMVTSSFGHLMTGFLHGQENLTWPALAEVVNKVVVVVFGSIALVLGLGVLGYASVLLAGAIVNFTLNALCVQKDCPLDIQFNPRKLKVLIMGGFPFLFMVLSSTAYAHTDIVMLRFFTNDVTVGWYTAASQIYRSVEFIPVALTTALLPTLSRMHFTHTINWVFIAKKGIIFIVLLIVPLGVGVSLLSKTVIAFLPYPETFQNSVVPLTLLAVSIPITATLMILGTIAIAVDRQNVWAWGLAGTVALNSALNAVTIPYFHHTQGNGAIGAASASLVCEVAMFSLAMLILPRQLIDRELVGLLGKAVLSGGMMAFAGLAARGFGFGDAFVAAVATLAFLTSVLAMKIVTIKDFQLLYEAVLDRARPAKADGRVGERRMLS